MMAVHPKYVVEAALLGAGRSIGDEELQSFIPELDLHAVLAELADDYAERGVCLLRTAGGWALRTRPESSDLATLLSSQPTRLTRAAMETLAVIAAFQPVTRGEIERVRGVQLSPGVMDQLLEAGFIRPGQRRETPGRPLTWMTTTEFLEGFDLHTADDLIALRRMREQDLVKLPPLRSLLMPGAIPEADEVDD